MTRCTEAFGIEPTEVWRQRHDHVRKSLHTTDCWAVGLKRQPFYSTDDAVRKVLEIVWPLKDKIRNFVREQNLTVTLVCNVTIFGDRPVYGLGADTIEKLAWLEAEFGLDIFDYSPVEAGGPGDRQQQKDAGGPRDRQRGKDDANEVGREGEEDDD